jgi:hypothetical protein
MPKPIRLSTLNFLVLAVLVFAAIMRLWNIENWTFINDELSAINRLRFDSWSDVLNKGVRIDAHPAATQFILYLTSSIFGKSEIALRLPFVILSLFSTFGIYQIGKKWIHANAGLIAATLFAGLGYTITYSVLARPYSLGVFAVVFVLLFWTKIIRTELKIPFLSYLGLGLMLALTAYSHYNAAIAATIIYLTGFMFIGKKKIKPYLLTGVFAMLVFLPHLWITIDHVTSSSGGLGWLAPPTSSAFSDYAVYAFNESWLILLTLIVFFAVKRFAFKENRYSSLTLVGLIVFSLSFMFAFLYSIYVAPIFQYSVVIFGFIGLLLLVADLIYFPKIKALFIQFFVLAGVLTFTTIQSDYRIESRFGTFEEIAKNIKVWEESAPDVNNVVAINSPNYLQYYLDKHESHSGFSIMKFKFNGSGEEDLRLLSKMVKDHQGNFFSYSKSSMSNRAEVAEVIKSKFPKTVQSYQGFNCQSTLYSRGNDNSEYIFRKSINAAGNDTNKFLSQYKFAWKELRTTSSPSNCQLVVTGQTKLSELKNVLIVVEIKRDGKPLISNNEVYWRGSNCANFINEANEWGFCASSVELPDNLLGEDEISIYLYNPNNVTVGFKNYEVKIHDR